MKATIYSKNQCPYCVRAKSLLSKLNIEYDEYIISDDTNATLEKNQHFATREDLLNLVPHARSVPQIWLDQLYIGGYTDLVSHLETKAA